MTDDLTPGPYTPEAAVPPRGVTWGLKEILIGTVATLVLLFVVSLVVVSPVSLAFGSDSEEERAAAGISNAVWNIATVFAVYWLVRRTGGDWRSLGIRAPDNGGRTKRLVGLDLPWTAWCILGGIAACYAALYIFSAVVQLFGLDWLEPGEQIPDEYFDNPLLVLSIGFAVVVTAPFAEEVFFRGFLFGGLRRGLPLLPAALISGAIFAIPHLDVGLMVPFTAIGAILANTYQAGRTLFTAICVHFLFNFVSFMILVTFPEVR
jgi:membrane protease YdiL (CAAX protease family)